MNRKIIIWLLATVFLATVSLAEAQRTGRIYPKGQEDPMVLRLRYEPGLK
ncbi:MAG: hypothetical protein ACREQA_23040 [Candidatus Binatia bacterium]